MELSHGSGKGALIGYSKSKFEDENVIIITTDDYKPFHPKASEIAQKYPTKYSRIVEQDSALWTSKILNYAIKNKYNFIFEVTLRNDRILARIKEMKENGFKVIIRGFAVSYIESLLSAFERYEKQVQTRSWGRFFNPLNYNETYKNIPNVIENIEDSGLFDLLEIYKRGEIIEKPDLIYANYNKKYIQNKNIEKIKNNYKSAKEAIISWRNEDLKHIDNIKERVEYIEKSFKSRKTEQEEEEGLNILKEIINNY